MNRMIDTASELRVFAFRYIITHFCEKVYPLLLRGKNRRAAIPYASCGTGEKIIWKALTKLVGNDRLKSVGKYRPE